MAKVRQGLERTTGRQHGQGGPRIGTDDGSTVRPRWGKDWNGRRVDSTAKVGQGLERTTSRQYHQGEGRIGTDDGSTVRPR